MNTRPILNNVRVFGFLTVLTSLLLGAGYFFGGRSGVVIALILAGAMNFGTYWFSDTIVLKLYKARPVDEEEFPGLHEMVSELSEEAGIPEPDLYMTDMRIPNAFATGRNPEKGVVCVTQGLMDTLDRDEVEGVIAHELAHIRNRDTLVNAVAATVAGTVSIMAEMLFWSALFAGRDEEMGNAVASLGFMILVPILATLIRMAISRSMEYRADSYAVKLTGNKDGLGDALRKISGVSASARMKGSKTQEAGSNLFIVNPFAGERVISLLSTHPSLDKRLDNISKTEL